MGFRIKTSKRKWKNPEYEKLYNNAVVQHGSDERFANTMSTVKGQLQYAAGRAPRSIAEGIGLFAREAPKIVAQGVTRAGISGYEAIGDLSTGLRAFEGYGKAANRNGGTLRERQQAGMKAYYEGLDKLKGFDERKYYNTPVGRLGSVQKEAQARAGKIIEGEDKLYTALNPMIDTILDVSDVTMVAAAPSLIKRFAKESAERAAKLSTNINKSIKAVDEGADVATFVKNKQAVDYITQNKNISPEEAKNILLKDMVTEDIEFVLKTPLSNNNRKFVAGVLDDSLSNNGIEKTVEKIAEIQAGIVKQLDNSTTQNRMVREALQEGVEKGDEVVQQKAIASYQLQKADDVAKPKVAKPDTDIAGKPMAKDAAIKRQEQNVKKAIRSRDAKKTIAESKKLTKLKKSKVPKPATKSKKQSIKQSIRPEKKVTTTERALLKKKLREQNKNLKAGKAMGKAEKKELIKTIQDYAKASGLPKGTVGNILSQKRIANISTEKQLRAVIKSINEKVGQNAGKVLKQSEMDKLTKEINAVKKLKKSYEKETGTQKVLNTLKSAANKAKTPEAKRLAVDQYKEAAKKAEEAQAHVTKMYEKIHRASATMGNTNAKSLAKRLGIPTRNQGFSAYLYSGKKFDKEMERFEKAVRLFKEGDKLIPEKAAWGFKQIGIEDADIIPQRLITEKHDIAEIMNSGTYKSVAPMFNSPQRMKRKSNFVREALSKAQEAEAVSEARVARHKVFFKDMKALLKTTPKKDRKASEGVIQGIVEDAGVAGNETEEAVAKALKDLFEDNAKYLEKTDDTFVRRQGYFPKNDVYDDDLVKLVKKNGIEDGLKAFFKEHVNATSKDAMRAMYNGMKGDSANFLKARKGDKKQADDLLASVMRYQSEFERLKLIREADPYIAAMKVVGDEVAEEASWMRAYAGMLEKALKSPSENKLLDKATGFMYVAKLGVSTPSAAANFVGGMSIDFLENGGIAAIKGAKRWGQNPVEMYKLFERNGMLGGNFIEYGTDTFTSKAGKIISKTAMLQQKVAENTIRIKQMGGLLSKESYAGFKKYGSDFKIPQEELVRILDNIERTQGHFSKLHTAPIFKTWYGKAALPFTRWMFNSADIMTQAAKDIATFPKHGDITRTRKAMGKFVRASMLIYGGTQLKEYATKDFSDTKGLNKIVKRAGEAMMETATGGALIPTSMAEMPLFEDAKKAAASYTLTKAKMGMGEYPFDYEEMDTMGDIYFFGTTYNKLFGKEKESVLSMYSEYNSMNPSDRAVYKRDVLAENKLAGRDVSSTFQRYERYSKNNITREEFDLSFISDKADKKKRVTKYINSLPKSEQAPTLQRLLKAKIVKKEDLQ